MIDSQRYPLLARIDAPSDLRTLAEDELTAVAKELREYLIESVSQSGGHFGAGLGVIELTVALHYLYDTPTDRLVWDVGHQCYPHKILTGRRDRIATIKQRGGLSPFPKPGESEYDVLSVGHSSTSISAALGMAIANLRQGDPRRTVAVIGELGASAAYMTAIGSDQFPTRARRPAWSVLDNRRFCQHFGLHLPHWQEGLDQVLMELAEC